MENHYKVLQGRNMDTLPTLADKSVHCCVTSPPYFGLRDYGHEGQIGLEETPEQYVANLVAVFREVKRVLRDDGTLWLNLGDSYYSTTKGDNRTNEQLSARSTLGPKRDGLKTDNAARMAIINGVRKMGNNGLKPKDLIGIPWRVAFALQADGWYLRQDIIEEVELYCPCGCGHIMEERIWRHSQDREIIWKKPNPMPESVTDRCTKAHEYIFLLTKSARYWYDAEAVKENFADERMGNPGAYKWSYANTEGQGGVRGNGGDTKIQSQGWNQDGANKGRNRRSVWTVATAPYKGAHFAVFPPDLIRPCVQAGCPAGGIVLDPFAGSGTTGQVAIEEGRKTILCELNADYCKLIERRLAGVQFPLMF